jgi:putative ABC transport system permease protein
LQTLALCFKHAAVDPARTDTAAPRNPRVNILTIPLRNLRRKLARTLLLVAVFALGVTSIVALNNVSTVVGQSLEKKLMAFGANILITPKAETLTVRYGGLSLGDLQFNQHDLPEAESVEKIRSIPMKERISAVAPKLVVLARAGEAGLGVVGVRFDEEKLIKNFWAVDGAYPSARGQVLAGADVARAYGLTPGGTMATSLGTFTVSGVLEPTGGDDDHVLLMDLGELQDLAGKPGAVSFIEVAALCSGCPIEEIVAEIGHTLHGVEIKAVSSIIKQRMFSITFVQKLALVLSLVILVTACAMVGLSMLSAVNERKKEIGILRSLGYSKGDVFGVFSFEALFLGLAAGVLGYVAGWALSFPVLATLDIAGGDGLSFGWGTFALACLAVAGVSVLSAAFPAWKASRVEPSEALVTL